MSDTGTGPARIVLVVDPDTHGRWALARALELEGYRVITAESGNPALELLETRHMDLVITEARLPDLDPFELLEWVSDNRPDLQAIVTDGDPSEEAAQRARNAGAIGYHPKPLDLVAFCAYVNACLKPEGFSGRVRGIDLLDYFQLLASTRKSKTVRVRHGDIVGLVLFDNGRLLHAETRDLTGVAAFQAITAWEHGTFTDLPFQAPTTTTITESTSFLLMEAARLRDERSAAGAGTAPPVDTGAQGTPAPSRMAEARSPHLEVSGEESGEDSTGDQRTFSELRASHQAFLDGLTGLQGVACAVLTSRAGLTFARSGTIPTGAEALIQALRAALVKTGAGLGLGNPNTATLYDEGRRAVHLRLLGAHVLGLWLEPQADLLAVSRWIDGHLDALS